MDAIFRGTTPEIIFKFKTVDVGDIDWANLIIKQWDNAIVTQALSAATVDSVNNTLSFTLTQANSLALSADKQAVVYLDWMIDSIRGTATPKCFNVRDSGKNEVVS